MGDGRKTQDTVHAAVQHCSEGTNVIASNSTRCGPMENCPLSQSHETKDRDMTAARAIFPEISPKGPVQDCYRL